MRIEPSAWQGNPDIYPMDPAVTSPGDIRRAGHYYWSQFLMIGTDRSPEPGQVSDFLTDQVESEGMSLESFDVVQASGKFVEYVETWSFRDLFTTTAHHWIWVEGQDHYHRVRVNLKVTSPIDNVRAIWTELLNFPDAYSTVAVNTKDQGLQTGSTLGSSNQHHFGQFALGRDEWLAFTDPQDGQSGSVTRVLLSSHSDIRANDEVTPLWADFDAFDNIELHVHREFPGVTMAPGPSSFMDNLLITNPAVSSTDWIAPEIERAKQWIDVIGPPIHEAVADPGDPVMQTFLPPRGAGNWSLASNLSPSPAPDANDTAIVNRIATLDSDVGAIDRLWLGNSREGVLHLESGGALQINDRVVIGAGSGANRAVIHQKGGDLSVIGSDPVVFLAYDSDDAAEYLLTDGRVQAGNLWFRFGNAVLTQTGGAVEVDALILGEGGTPSTAAIYELHGGTLTVAGTANIGKGPGNIDSFPDSNGSLRISDGTAMFGGLSFGDDASDTIQFLGAGLGLLHVRHSNYSEADALMDISTGNITGVNLSVSTLNVGAILHTEIRSLAVLAGDFNADGVVNLADYTVWRNNPGSTYDLNPNGVDDGLAVR